LIVTSLALNGVVPSTRVRLNNKLGDTNATGVVEGVMGNGKEDKKPKA
jgi:hypothetical protein